MPYFKLGMDKELIVPYTDYLNAIKPDFKFIGDKDEIIDLVRCLYLPNANSVKLVGPTGAGATALMDALTYHQTSDFMPDDFMVRPIFKFNSNNLFSTADSSVIERRFSEAMEKMQMHYHQRKVKPILVIDDGCTFTDNAPQHVINSLIEAAVRADYLDLVVGVDQKKEQEFNETHPEFVNSFTTKEVNEPNDDQLMDILAHHAQKHEDKDVLTDNQTLEHVIDITQRFKGMYGTAQPNRAIRLLDSAATAFMIEIHSRAPGSYDLEQSLKELRLKIDSGKIEGEELENLEGQAETLQIELDEANVKWEEHREKIKSLQEEIHKFDVLIAGDNRKIEKYDAETKEMFFNDLKELLSEREEGDPVFKGRAKSDILNLGQDDLLKFGEFDLHVNRNPHVEDLQRKIATNTESIEMKQKELSKMSEEMHQKTLMPTSIVDEIAEDVTKTPVAGVSGRLKENLRNGVELMEQSVFGQSHVIEPMVEALRYRAAGLGDQDRPLGVFLIAGPPGTGKTWMAEQLAVKLFGSKDYYSELNMQDYMGSHSTSALFGTSQGFTGYGKRGELIKIGQDKPFGVVCLDEIEKAHPDVRQSLLTVFSKGYARGLDGEEADFRNIIFVSTSNFGNDKNIWDGSYEDGVAQFNSLLRQSRDVFSAEYIDRHDGTLCAGPLDENAFYGIAAREINGLNEDSKRSYPNLNLSVAEDCIRNFVKDHSIGNSGRATKMAIGRMVGQKFANHMLSGVETVGTFGAKYNPATKLFEFGFEKGEPSVEMKTEPAKQFAKLNKG